MSETRLAVTLQHALVEEAVLRAIAGHDDERAFRRARDRLYELPEGDAREDAFWALHSEWFARLGLGRVVHEALAELPALAEQCQRCVLAAATTGKDEGADLLVDGALRTVLICLRPTAFLDPDALLALLRFELLHVADMVDPAFGYQPALPEADGGPGAARLLQDRYRALWNATVAGRLARRGVAGTAVVATVQRGFATAFPMLGEALPAAFERFFGAVAPTHAELLAFAISPRGIGFADPLVPGGRCPLCRFLTHDPEPDPEHLPAELLARIADRFSAWRPADGLCRHCADLYRARDLSLAAAALLPG